MLKRLFLLLVLTIFCGYGASAQQQEDEEEGIDTKTLAFGVTTSNFTNLLGGLVARSSIPVSVRKDKTVNQYLAIEILNIKNPREYSQFYGFGPKYTLGKKNYLFSLRPEYGREFNLFERSPENHVGMSVIFAGGPSLGIVKPYYVKYDDNNFYQQFNPNISGRITGVGGILKNGLKGSKYLPGVHFKIAGNIDINTFGDNITGIELGGIFETFFKEIEIMTPEYSDNPSAFTHVYLTIYLGNKKITQPKSKSKKKAKKADGLG